MPITNKPSTHETWNSSFRKKYRGHSALALVGAPGTLIFDPPPGATYKVSRIYTVIRRIVGVVGTPPQFKLTNGTNDIMAAAAITGAGPAANGNVQEFTPTVNANTKIDAANPLRLQITVAQVGGTTYLFDVLVKLEKISD